MCIVLEEQIAVVNDVSLDLLDRGTIIGVQGSYYYNTMFGPLGGSLGYSNRTRELYFYLNLGYEF
ncbi:MAG: hypothetical protein IJT55_02915 [Prevotella sp.]|nr:hypothetical protein [Prevotella sp.]